MTSQVKRPLIKIIACQVIFEELPSAITERIPCSVLDYGLHIRPDHLKAAIQKEIDRTEGRGGVIFLGYGLCAQAVVGLQSPNHWLAAPKFHDCIGVFLGSEENHRTQAATEPGTYYLTRGWIEAGEEPLGGMDKLIAQYGRRRATSLIKTMLKNYTRLLFIRTGENKLEYYRQYSKRIALQYGLRFEEQPGSNTVMEKAARENWDHDFVTVSPGTEIKLDDFLR